MLPQDALMNRADAKTPPRTPDTIHLQAVRHALSDCEGDAAGDGGEASREGAVVVAGHPLESIDSEEGIKVAATQDHLQRRGAVI